MAKSEKNDFLIDGFPRNEVGTAHIVHLYIEDHMSPRRNWDPPPPLAQANVPLPPEPKGGGAHSPAGEGAGLSQF
jgi:hypothetical protein